VDQKKNPERRKARDLPVEQPMKFELVFNLKRQADRSDNPAVRADRAIK